MASIDQAVAHKIAWDFLERGGLMGDPLACARFLDREIEKLCRRGISSRLLLSNRAIAAYLEDEKQRKATVLGSLMLVVVQEASVDR